MGYMSGKKKMSMFFLFYVEHLTSYFHFSNFTEFKVMYLLYSWTAVSTGVPCVPSLMLLRTGKNLAAGPTERSSGHRPFLHMEKWNRNPPSPTFLFLAHHVVRRLDASPTSHPRHSVMLHGRYQSNEQINYWLKLSKWEPR